MKTLSCIGDAQLALGAQDTPEEGKECVTYPCYPRPNKTPVVLISNPDLTLFYTWPWEIWVQDYCCVSLRTGSLLQVQGKFFSPYSSRALAALPPIFSPNSYKWVFSQATSPSLQPFVSRGITSAEVRLFLSVKLHEEQRESNFIV